MTTPSTPPTPPTARDVRVWIGARDFEMSLRFYDALGWTIAWTDGEGLAHLELAGHRFVLQDYYAKQWCENSMVTVDVDDASAWFEHVSGVLSAGTFGSARVSEPRREDYGAIVTYVWDPSGVLLHLTEWPDA
ncbi:MAG: hypothetical protein R2697_12445 [Ilumatobacteraceae bacterium]